MSTLKKKLLKIISIALVSSSLACSTKAPKLESPINRSIPIFTKDQQGKTQVHSWQWDEYFTGKQWETSNEETRKVVPICVDGDSYARGEAYGKNLARYVEYLEKELDKEKAKKRECK